MMMNSKKVTRNNSRLGDDRTLVFISVPFKINLVRTMSLHSRFP